MNWNKWIRHIHRWLGVAFTVTVIANIIVMSVRKGQQPPDWMTYAPLLPLGLLWCSGMYLFVLPYSAKWRTGRRAVT